VIATIRVLGLRAGDPGTVAVAARRVVAYVQGTGVDAGHAGWAERLLRRHGRRLGRPRRAGRARGMGASLVGLGGEVADGQLERLLAGRDAVTGRRLLPAAGSAGRAGMRAGDSRRWPRSWAWRRPPGRSG